jgi:hypothetical protein
MILYSSSSMETEDDDDDVSRKGSPRLGKTVSTKRKTPHPRGALSKFLL